MECSDGMENKPQGHSTYWADMAPDLLANIFLRLPMKQLLLDIPLVCKPWKLASLDPLCWRTLDFPQPGINVTSCLLQLLLQRSNGLLQEFTLPCEQDPQCLQLLAHSAPLLQKLHISESCANDKWATYAAPLMPCITDLDLSLYGNTSSHVALEAFGKNCRGITKLRRNNYIYYQNSIHLVDDSEAYVIAEHYPRLEYLELRANPLSTQGLQAILDRCPLLEHLDVAGCVNIMFMDNTLLNFCHIRLKVFVEPSCATFDEEYSIEDDLEDEDYWIDEYSIDGDHFEDWYSDEFYIDNEFWGFNGD